MSEWAPNVTGRLEEIDRRLREIQAELIPGRVPRETRGPVNPSDSDSPAAPNVEPDLEPNVEPNVEPNIESDVAAADDVIAPEPVGATELDSDEHADRPRGRSGPLAEALQRARSARVAGLTASAPPSPDRAAPPPSASEPRDAEPPAVEPPQAAEASAEEPPPAPPHTPPPAPPQTTEPDPPPPARPAPPTPPPAPHALRQARLQSDPRVDVLAELQSSLLTATRDLLDGYERASFTASERRANRVTISAGPFKGTESLHSFEQELSALPGVHGVDVRGYEGADRAIIEVELDTPEER